MACVENLKLFVNNQHCKHIVLAGSQDSGYVGDLRKYVSGRTFNGRISLIETVPFPPHFQALVTQSQLEVRHLPQIFRSDKFDVARSAMKVRRSPPVTYAARANPAAVPAVGNTPTSPMDLVMYPERQSGEATSLGPKIYLNSQGQRLDERLLPSDRATAERLKALKLCNRHFLTRCTYGNECRNEHNYPPLSEVEKAALKRIARSAPCPRGSYCDDRDCVLAHSCSYGDRCEYGPERCLFPHVADKMIARAV